MVTIINLLFDVLFLLSSIIGYYISFFSALKLDYSLKILFVLCLIGLLYYFIFRKLSKKWQIIFLILCIIPFMIYFSSLVNGSKQLAMEIFARYKVKDKKFNIPYITYEESAWDAMISIFLINIPITISLAHYYAKKKRLLLHYLPAILLLWIPLLYQLVPDYIYFSMFLIPLFVQYLCRYQSENSYVVKGIVTGILVILCSVMILNYNEDHEYQRLISFDHLQTKINNAGKSINNEKTISETKKLSDVGIISPTQDIELYADSEENHGSFKLKGMVYDQFVDDTWIHQENDETTLNNTSRRLLNLHKEHDPYSMQIYTSMQIPSTLYEPYFVTVSKNGSCTYIAYQDIYANDYDDTGEFYANYLQKYIDQHYDLYTSVPSVYDEILEDTLEKIGILDSDSAYEKAVKIRDYFSTEFTYTYIPEAVAEDSTFVESFLESKKGYCVHYAATAALLLRKAGVMTRYVEGYQASEYDSANSRYILRNADKHAWIEYFDDSVGWLPFEVTNIYNLDSCIASYETITYEKDPDNENESDDLNPAEEIAVPIEEEQNTAVSKTAAVDPDHNTIPVSYILPIGIILILILVRIYRTILFRKYNRQGHNQYVLFLYHQLDDLGIQVPENIYNLVLKAMYSKDELNDQEYQKVENYYFSTLQNTTGIKKILIYYYYYIRRKNND